MCLFHFNNIPGIFVHEWNVQFVWAAETQMLSENKS